MAGIARGDVEILVHTTAPSRGPDDARFRALAQAYLDFIPAVRRRFDEEIPSERLDETVEEVESQLRDELHSRPAERESAASYRPLETQEQETATTDSFQLQAYSHPSLSDAFISPELSFNSAIDNADSPFFRRPMIPEKSHDAVRQQSQRQSQTLQDSWQPPPSIVPDSQPDGSKPDAMFASPSRFLEIYLRELTSSGEPLPQLGRQRRDKTSEASREASANGDHAPSTFEGRVERNQTTSSGISSSPPRMVASSNMISEHSPENQLNSNGITPEFRSPVLPKRKRTQDDSESTNMSSSIPAPSSAALDTTSPSTHPSKRLRTTTSSTSPQPFTKAPNSSIPSSTQSPIQSRPPSLKLSTLTPWSHTATIRPPPPPVSTQPLLPSSLITPSLGRLLRKMSSPALYKPAFQGRELRHMERGYWRIDMKNWDPALRERCWDVLGRFVGGNKAGWGVWCIREAQAGNEGHREVGKKGKDEGLGRASQGIGNTAAEGQELSVLRVYCWGIVVKHIYLLLYMASESKVRKVEAVWIGGDGAVVVGMNG